MDNKINRQLASIQFFILAAYASYFNFFILFLSDKGYSKVSCGLIQAFIAILTFLYQPLIGHVIDRYLSYKKVTALIMITLMVLSIIIPASSPIAALLGLFVVLHAVTMRQIPVIIDAWTVSIKLKHKHITYENTRGMGSIGAGLASVLTGLIIGSLGYNAVFFMNAFFVFLAFLLTRQLEDVKEEGEIEASKIPFKEAFKKLLRSKPYMTFMFSALFLNIGIKVINSFGSLIMKDIGGDSTYYGWTMLVCGIVEALTLVIVGKLIHKISLEMIYLIGILSLGIGSVLIFFTPHLVTFIIGRSTLGMTYSVYIAIVVGYITKLIEPSLKATAMGVLMAGTGGIANILSSLGGGFVLEWFSFKEAGWVMMALTLIAFLLFIPNLKTNKVEIFRNNAL